MNVPTGALAYPTPEILTGEILGRVLYIGVCQLVRGSRRYPAPAHRILAKIATDPAVRPQGVKGLCVNGLPAPGPIKLCRAATAQLVPTRRASRTDDPVVACRVITPIQKLIQAGDIEKKWPQILARVALYKRRPCVVGNRQDETVVPRFSALPRRRGEAFAQHGPHGLFTRMRQRLHNLVLRCRQHVLDSTIMRSIRGAQPAALAGIGTHTGCAGRCSIRRTMVGAKQHADEMCGRVTPAALLRLGSGKMRPGG